MKLMLICKAPDIARYAVDAGVDTIFVDLEKLGKSERQGQWDTVKSDHTISDIKAIRSAVGDAEILVRTNPLHGQSEREVDAAIEAGADCLMLPMFKTAAEVAAYRDIVAGRARIKPLIETREALADYEALARLDGIESYHFGLNDLHIAFGCRFIFEPLVNGELDAAIDALTAAGRPFGIGGVARSDEGIVAGNLVLEEYLRRGASSVILSRTFHRGASTLDQLQSRVDFKKEILALQNVCARTRGRSAAEWDTSRKMFESAVRRSVAELPARADARA